MPTFSIIVPVKDEEKVVCRLLDSLLNLDYPIGRKEIVVVEDGSEDETAKLCDEYVQRYPEQLRLVRQLASKGKPSALNCALRHVKGEIVAVLDADNVAERDLLLKAARYFEDPSIAAVQGRQCAINADVNRLSKFISYEETVRYEAYLRGKDVLRMFVPLTGSCYFVRKAVLDEVGGWDDEALSEDMELSARLTECNYKVKYASDVLSWQENPANLGQLFRQRTRWFRGCMDTSLRYGRLVKRVDRRSVDAEVTLLAPFMFVPVLLGYLLGILTLVGSIQPDFVSVVMVQGTMLLTTATLFLIGVALFYVTKPRKLTNLLWVPFVYVYWTVQSFIALYAMFQIVLKRPGRWTKTEKTGALTNHAV